MLDIPLQLTALSDVVLGQNVGFVLSATAGMPPYTWSVAPGSSLPPGLQLLTRSSLNMSFAPGATGLAGSPTAAGSYSFDLIVTDAAGTQVRRTYRLNVSRIALVGFAPPAATTGIAYSARLVAVGGTGAFTFSMSPVSLTQEMLPPGFSMSNAGVVSGTTTSTGVYSFVLRVQDTAGNTFSRSFTLLVNTPAGLRVQNVNPADAWTGFGRRSTVLTTNGPSTSTYAWAVVAGALPPGVTLVPGLAGPNSTVLAGPPAATGTYTFTLRATDVANGALFAEHAFTQRIGATQLVSPPVAIAPTNDLPGGQAGSPYSVVLKAAGGTPPYTFSESPFSPLPPGLSLSAAGVLSGTPASIGTFSIVPIVSDSSGTAVTNPGLVLVVTPAGSTPPLVRAGAGLLPDASAGVPYRYALDPILRGGTAPFTWSVASAAPPAVNALPSGISILAGSNGLPTYLGGAPTTPGPHTFSLLVTDASTPAQTLVVPLTIAVSSLALTPDSLPRGMAGTPYAQALLASGGTGPYTVQLSATSDMPPGMSLSGGSLLSGTPAQAGNFLVTVLVSDAAGNSLAKAYKVTVDNAAGQAPALALSPATITRYCEIGSAALRRSRSRSPRRRVRSRLRCRCRAYPARRSRPLRERRRPR